MQCRLCQPQLQVSCTALQLASTKLTICSPIALATSALKRSRSRVGRHLGCGGWRCTHAHHCTLHSSHSSPSLGIWACKKQCPDQSASAARQQSSASGRGSLTVWVPHVRGESAGWRRLWVVCGECEQCIEEAPLAAAAECGLGSSWRDDTAQGQHVAAELPVCSAIGSTRTG